MNRDAPITGQAWRTLAITAAAVFMVSVELTIIALALADIREAFPGTSTSTLSWVITAYNIGVASLLLVSGWLADRYGWRRYFVTGMSVFAAASLLAGLAPNVEVLITARVLQSVGGALQYPAGMALLLSAFPPSRHSTALGFYAGVGGLAAAAGPSLGALLVEGFGWRSVFLLNVPIAAGAAAVGNRYLAGSDRTRPIPERVDLISVPMASIGVGAAILGIVKGEDWGWSSPPIIFTFAICIVLIAVFVIRSRVHPVPLFDLRLFRLPTYTIGNIGTVLFGLGFFSWLVVLPTVIQTTWGWSVLKTGFAIAPSPAIAFLISPAAGRLADRIGNGSLFAIGGLFGVASGILHIALFDSDPAYVPAVLIPGQLMGVAAGLGFAQVTAATMRDVGPHQYGMGGAGRTTIFQLATAMAIAVGFTLLGEPGTDDLIAGFHRVMVLSAVCYAAQTVLFSVIYPHWAER